MINLDLNFINRVIKTTVWVAFILALFIAQYYNILFAAGLILGAIWNCINFWFIKKLLLGWLDVNPLSKSKLAIFLVIKFVVLYGAGFFILISGIVPVLSFLCGFSLLFSVIFLKALGIIIISRNQKKNEIIGNRF